MDSIDLTTDFIDFIDLVKEVLGPTLPRNIKSKLLKSSILKGIPFPKNVDKNDLLLEAARRCYLRIFPRALSTDLPYGFKDLNDGYYINGDAISDSVIIDHKTIINNEMLEKIPIRVFNPLRRNVWFYTPEEIVEAIHRRLSFIQPKVSIVAQPVPHSELEQRSICWSPEISHGFPLDYNNQEFTSEQIRSIFHQLLLADAFRPNGPVIKYPEVLAFFMNYEELYKKYRLLLEKKQKKIEQWMDKKMKKELSIEKFDTHMDTMERNMKFEVTRLFQEVFSNHNLKFVYTIVPSWTCSRDSHENLLDHDIEVVDPGLIIQNVVIDGEEPKIVSVFKGVHQKPIPTCDKCRQPKTPGTEGPGAVKDDRWVSNKKQAGSLSRLFFSSASKRPFSDIDADEEEDGDAGGAKKKK